MSSLTLTSPAKLNLTLDVLAKRADGFHSLSTLFQRINLFDDILLTANATGRVSVRCNHPHVPTNHQNLVIRIAQRLKEDFKIKKGVDIVIHKRIPVAAGLAGGSSNGAAVLKGLNQMWDLKLSQKKLIDYAAWLGSDVAFFIYNTSFALGEGRGEQITPLNLKVKLWHVLVTPRVKMLTKDVFACLKFNLTKKVPSVNILLPFLKQGDVMRLSGCLSNDLESAIITLRPDLIYIKEKLLRAGALGACFSGSGPSLYALARSQEHAHKIRAKFDKRFTQVFVVSTL